MGKQNEKERKGGGNGLDKGGNYRYESDWLCLI